MASGMDERSTRVFVGNLSWKSSWQNIKDYFRSAGDVVRVTLLQFPDGRSKGCAIVVFATPEGAANAIANLSDTMWMDRKIFVREDREDDNRPPRRDRGPGYAPNPRMGRPRSGYRNFDDRRDGGTIVVSGLSSNTTWQDLKDFVRDACESANDVTRADVRKTQSGLQGFVSFRTAESADRASAALDGIEYQGQKLHVRRQTARSSSSPRDGRDGGDKDRSRKSPSPSPH